MSCQFHVYISCHVNFRGLFLCHVKLRCTFHAMSISGVYLLSCKFHLYISCYVNFRYRFHFMNHGLYFMSCQLQVCISCHVNFICTFHVFISSCTFNTYFFISHHSLFSTIYLLLFLAATEFLVYIHIFHYLWNIW